MTSSHTLTSSIEGIQKLETKFDFGRNEFYICQKSFKPLVENDLEAFYVATIKYISNVLTQKEYTWVKLWWTKVFEKNGDVT